MNTIKLRVEAAMRKSWYAYYGYMRWLAWNDVQPKCFSRVPIFSRTLAVVQHDRVLNNR